MFFSSPGYLRALPADRREILHHGRKPLPFNKKGTKISGNPPKKTLGAKNQCKIWLDFGQLHTSTANISSTSKDIQNQKSI